MSKKILPLLIISLIGNIITIVALLTPTFLPFLVSIAGIIAACYIVARLVKK